MSDQLSMFDLPTLPATPNAIGSEALESGATPSDAPDGTMPDPYGPAVAPVNRSVPQAVATGTPIPAIFGRSGSTSSASAALQLSLASKLRQRLDTAGSTLFTLTWKDLVTPSGRRICALRASARRTSGNASSSWRSPAAQNADRGGQDALERIAAGHTVNLQDQATLASWATPAARDYRSESATDAYNAERWGHTRGKPLSAEATLASGPIATGFPAETEKRGQLNAGLSRWLQGLPVAWDAAAIRAYRLISSTRRKRV